MNSLKKPLALACAASVLSFGVAVAQTPPSTPDAGAAPAAGDTAAPAADTTMKKPMKKKMMSKKMSKKKMMKKKAM